MEATVVWMLSFITCFTVTCPHAEALHTRHVPAMFVFGDSLADAGNNNFIPHSAVRANFTPYGVSFFPHPTGRFSNGRTAFDFLATYLGLPFPPPLLNPAADFARGINFASGNSGLLDSTGTEQNILSLNHQIQQFEHLYETLGSKLYLAKSLYCISIGGNDIGNYLINYNSAIISPQQLITLILTKFDRYLDRLYYCGARKFLVIDVSALGCTPRGRNYAYGTCFEPANNLAVAYNRGLKGLVDERNKRRDGASIILLNSYDYLTDIIDRGEAYGFSETRSACCGSGKLNAEVGCGKTTPQALFCNDTNAYVFWDAVHPTQAVYAILSHQIWTGNSSVIYPFNLSTLTDNR